MQRKQRVQQPLKQVHKPPRVQFQQQLVQRKQLQLTHHKVQVRMPLKQLHKLL